MTDDHLAVREAGGSRPAVGGSSIDWVAVSAMAPADGFSLCVRSWAPELGQLAYLLTGDHHGADDLVADALLAAWAQWPSVMAADNPRAYVRRIVVNKAASGVRRSVLGRANLRLLAAQVSGIATSPDVPGAVDLHRALAALPERQRLCLVLRYGLDLPEAEVAAILDIRVGTVKSQTSLAARRLRKLLQMDDRS